MFRKSTTQSSEDRVSLKTGIKLSYVNKRCKYLKPHSGVQESQNTLGKSVGRPGFPWQKEKTKLL